MDSEFLDDLEQVDLFIQLSLRVLEQEVFSLLLGSTAAANCLVEAPEVPEAAVLVRECLSDLKLAFDNLLVVCNLGQQIIA